MFNRGAVLFFCVILLSFFNYDIARASISYHLSETPTPVKETYRYSDEFTVIADSLVKTDINAFVAYLNKILLQYKEANNWEGETYVLTELGIEEYVNSRFDSAIILLSKAYHIASEKSGMRHPAVARASYYIGQCYFYKGNPQEALDFANKALEIFQVYYGDDYSIDISNVYRVLGNVNQYLLADYFEAGEYYTNALAILEQVSDSEDEKFRLYYDIGVCNREKKDFETAFTVSKKALKYILSQEDKDTQYIELSLALHANVLIELDSFSSALNLINKAISYNNINYGGNPNVLLVQHINNLGFINTKLAEYKKAEENFLKGLSMSKGLYGDENLLNRSYIFENLAIIADKKGDNKKALRYFQMSLEVRKEIYKNEAHRLIGETYKSIGTQYLKIKDYNSALEYFQKAFIVGIPHFNDTSFFTFPTQKQLSSHVNAIELVSFKSNTLLSYYKENNKISYLKSALLGFNLADSLITIYQDIYPRETTKLRFLNLFHDIYEGGIEAAFILNEIKGEGSYLENAFYLMENSKAKLLTESFRKAQIQQQVGLPDSIIQAENNINQQIAYYQKEQNASKTQEKLFNLDSEKRQITNYIKRNFPDYYKEKYKDVPFSINEIQELLKNQQQVLLSYYLGKKAVYKVILTKDNLSINKTEENIKPLIDNLYYHLQKGYMAGDRDESFKDFVLNNAKLSEILIRQKEQIIQPNDGLIISPDHLLSYIPFEVLFSQPIENEYDMVNYRSLPYLIKAHDIQYTYSAVFLLDNYRLHKEIPKDPSVLAFSYSAHSDKGKSSSVRKMMANIPGAPIELDAINKYFNGDYLYGEEASETVFKEKAADFNIFHLAIHGTANQENTYGAYLQFRPDTEIENDGRLYNFELYNLKFNADLAVLSACESGMGKMNRGEGLLSIGRSFAYAGCPTTMMSLWQVNDYATASIISDFYQSLNQGASIKKSLKKAKLSYLHKADELTAHPAYWAPMVTYGSNPSLQKTDNRWIYVLLGILTLLGISIVIKKKHLPQ